MTNNETDINNVTKLYNRPFEEMSLLELYAEIGVHNWHRGQMKKCIEKLKKRKWWLENNKPILSKEEIKRQYENGEISKNQYQTAFATRKVNIDSRMHMEDRMKYAEIVALHEEAVVEYLNELKAERQTKDARNAEIRKENEERYKKGYDPRRNKGKYNINETLDPNRRWATREDFKPLPRLRKARARWKKVQSADNAVIGVNRRLQPILQWNTDKLRDIAKDRGWYTDAAMLAMIAETLNITIMGAQKLLDTGKLSWGQCIVIGALFEMTPKEFCDVFLSGYFREVGSGVYRAYVEDTSALLDRPYQARPKAEEGADDDDNDI